jgi:hypothetical protein
MIGRNMNGPNWLAMIALAFLAALAAAGTKRDEPFVVIVHPSNHFDTLNRAKLEFLFLRKVSRWPWGAEAEPVDLEANSPARREFTKQVLRTTEERLAAYWIDLRTTRGISPPPRMSASTAVKAFVASHPGAVAYIPEADLDATVKAIRIDP